MTDLFAKVNCTYCQEEINGLRVQCCVCSDFDMCLQCFASGAEIGPHRNDHSYKFVDHCAVSIFGGRGSWMGREELQLLEAMEMYGFGNWEFVSKQIETRTAEEVKEEYILRYLEGNIGKVTWAEVTSRRPSVTDETPDDLGPLAPAVIARLPPLDASVEEARQLGYMSHRDDFDREYDTAAEQLVSSLQLNMHEDNSTEIALKLAQVDMYTRRLRDRARRKRVVRDYQLVAKFFSHQRKDLKKPLTKEQRELREKFRVFSQFLTSAEQERLMQNIERERELRFRLSELLRYRSLGITTQEEAIHFEQHAAFQQQQQIKLRQSGSTGYATSTLQEILIKNGKSDADQSSREKRFMWSADGELESLYSNSSISESVKQPPVSALPQGNLLSQNEIQLCSTLNLEPVQYTTMKALIIQEHCVPNTKSKLSEVESDSSELSVKEAVAQYLGTCGWLPGVVM